MRTITFYSYKGGTGRTLAVANVAKYLALFGQKVFVVDCDLEAPGLHYKFGVDGTQGVPEVTCGVVDYISAFLAHGKLPDSLGQYTCEIECREESGGSIRLMPAGNILSATYWRQLAQVNWHDLFYTEGAEGIPFFLEFKVRIAREFQPDFLLIDARTGITEVGGVVTSILPDTLVCLLLYNRETLEGTREVMRGVKRASRLSDEAPVHMIPVISRLPVLENATRESAIVQEVGAFLNETALIPQVTLALPEVCILHSEPELQLAEALRVGGMKTPDESPLLRDYIKLFTQLIPKEVIEPHMRVLIEQAVARGMDDPEAVEHDLRLLVDYYPHLESYTALLKYHRLRNASPDIRLRTAWRCWEATGEISAPILWDTVKATYVRPATWGSVPVPPMFVQQLWKAAGEQDSTIGVLLAEHYSALEQEDQAADILLRLLEHTQPTEEVVVQCLSRLLKTQRWSQFFDVVERYRTIFSENTSFRNLWASAIASHGDVVEARKFLETEGLHIEHVEEGFLEIYAQVLNLGEHIATFEALLDWAFSRAVEQGTRSRAWPEVSAVFRKYGRERELAQKLRTKLGGEAEAVLQQLSLG